MERINNVYYKLVDGVKLPYLSLEPSSRLKTWITHEQMALEYPEAVDMMAFVLAEKAYPEKAKDFVRSLLFFLEVDGHLSWKQFDSVFFLFESYDAFKHATKNGTTLRKKGNLIAARRGGISFVGRITNITDPIGYISTDREFDRLYTRVFDSAPIFEDNFDDDGEPVFITKYRGDGSRWFALPTDEDMTDLLLSNSDRVAVAKFFNKGLR